MSEELRALAEKYREMIALRRDPGPKDEARLRALAARFPGSLRELDTRTMTSLEERLFELESGVAPSWARHQIRFHGWLRVALRMRAESIRDLASARAWVLAYTPSDAGDPSVEELGGKLATLIAPREGRVSLGARDALDAVGVDLEALLFGAP